jgi:hypothetical protein
MVAQLRYRGNASSYKAIEATGGTVSTAMVDGVLHKVHYFTNAGASNFVVAFPGSKDRTIKYIVIGGGGGGGAADNETEAGAGGGAGGYREGTFILTEPVNIPIVVGSNGIGRGGSANCQPGTNGGDSSLGAPLNIVASGGGGGGTGQGSPGLNGGSGGGSNSRTTVVGLGNTPATTPPQGYNGARGTGNIGGGGGGSAANASGQSGGSGRTSSITGPLTTYAIGGSGGNFRSYGFSPAEFGSGGGGGGARGENAGFPDQFMNPGINGRPGAVIISYPISPKLGFDSPAVPSKISRPMVSTAVLYDTVTWLAPNDNGAQIIEYQWESTDGKTGTTTSLGVTLSQEGNTSQAYRVRARNSVGYGAWSDDSSSVTTPPPFFPFFPFFPHFPPHFPPFFPFFPFFPHFPPKFPFFPFFPRFGYRHKFNNKNPEDD